MSHFSHGEETQPLTFIFRNENLSLRRQKGTPRSRRDLSQGLLDLEVEHSPFT